MEPDYSKLSKYFSYALHAGLVDKELRHAMERGIDSGEIEVDWDRNLVLTRRAQPETIEFIVKRLYSIAGSALAVIEGQQKKLQEARSYLEKFVED